MNVQLICRLFFLMILHSTFQLPAAAQEAVSTPDKESLPLDYSRVHADWISPEALLAGLRSSDGKTRLSALTLLGVPTKQSQFESRAAANSQAGSEVAMIDEAELRYATLGSDDSLQAIVVANVSPVLHGAVAIRRSKGWERIASFSCWCKYENGDLLNGFVQVEFAPDGRSELVVRDSGGGTGVYSQTEYHFRIHHGELRLVLSFVSRAVECQIDPGETTTLCHIQRRWFKKSVGNSGSLSVLVELSNKQMPDGYLAEQFGIRDLEIQQLRQYSCKTYKWNEKSFWYEQVVDTNLCKPKKQQ